MTRRAVACLAALVLVLGLAPLRGAAAAEVPHVLVFSATYGFRHPSITHGNEVLRQLAAETGRFTVEFSEDPAVLNATKLAAVDQLLFNSTTGRFPISDQQRATLERYWACGGGFVGVHAAADANYGWPGYAELIGALFSSHPHNAADGEVRLHVENQDHPVNAAYAGRSEWFHEDEYYRWQRDVRGRQDVAPLLSLDETTVAPAIQQGPEAYWPRQPLAWTKTFRGGGRVYYTNLGHNDATWDRPEVRQSLVDGITWVSEVRLSPACFTGTDPLPQPQQAPAPGAATPPQECAVAPNQARAGTGGVEERIAHPAAPSYFAQTKRPYVVDLTGQRRVAADVTMELTWPFPADDYDLGVTAPWGFFGSDAAQPVAPARETVTVRGVPHCAELLATVYNWRALSQQAPTLRVSVTPVAAIARAAGATRTGTAAAVSQATGDRAATVVVARADRYPDALAGAPLAAQLGGPLLLSAADRLSADAAAEVRRLQATRAVLLGGEAALSPRVAADLAALGVHVERIAGRTRFGTAARIAERMGSPRHVLVVEGDHPDPARGWPDALSASALGALRRTPVLLVTSGALPAETARAVQGADVTIVGGTGAVGAAVEQQLRARAASVTRLAGDDRYGTSARAAEAALAAGAAMAQPWVATGREFADGLAAGAAAGRAGSVLLLVDGRDATGSAATTALLRERADDVVVLRLAGGAAAIAPATADALESALRPGAQP